MSFDWVTFLFQLVNVLVLIAILAHFLFRPVADIIAKRQAETEAALSRAESARQEAEEAAAAARKEANSTAAARQDILATAKAEAAKERKHLLESAHAEAEKIVKEGHATATVALKETEAEALSKVCDLAQAIAARALSNLPDPPTPAGFADRLIDVITRLPDKTRTDLIQAGDLRLVSATPLSPADHDAIRDKLRDAGVPEGRLEVDQELIAGLELRSAAGIVHNSLAHDLARIAKAMGSDDRSGS